MPLARSQPRDAADVLTLSEGIGELWAATRPKVDVLRQGADPTRLREINTGISQMSHRVWELLEQSEGETSMDEQIEAYAQSRHLPLIAARARILPHLGIDQRRQFELELQSYFSRLDIPAMMERGDENEIAETVLIFKVLRNEGYLDFIAVHSAYFAYDRGGKTAPDIAKGTAVQKHIDKWKTEKHKIINNLPHAGDELLVLGRCLTMARMFLLRLKRQDKSSYENLIALATRTIRMSDMAKEFTQDSWKEGRPVNEGMDCDENTNIGRLLALSADMEIHQCIEVDGHASLLFNRAPLVFDVYDNRIRTVDEFLGKEEYSSDSPEGRAPSYYYRTSTREMRARYDEGGRVIGYEQVNDNPYVLTEYDDVVSILSGQALYFQNTDKWKTAEQIHEFARRVDPKSTQPLINLSRVKERQGDYVASRARAEEALQLHAHNKIAYTNLGVAAERTGDLIFAREQYERAVVTDPYYALGYSNLAKIHRKMGNIDAQKTALINVIELEPSDIGSINVLVDILMNSGDSTDAQWAAEYLMLALSVNSKHLPSLKKAGKIFVRLRRFEDAARVYAEAVKVSPDDADLRWDRAQFFRATGNTDLAIEEYEEMLRINTKDNVARNSLAIVRQDKGDFVEAERLYREALVIDPLDSDIHNNLALILMQVHRHLVEAEHHLRESIRFNAASISPHLALADVLSQTARQNEGRQHLAEFVRLGGSETNAIYLRIKGVLDKNN